MAGRNRKVEELLADDSFIRWIEGRASAKEIQFWDRWKAADPNRPACIDEAKKLHQSIRFAKKQRNDIESELEKLNRSLNQKEPVKKRLVHLPRHRRKKTASVFLRVAAVVMVAVLASVFARFLLQWENNSAIEPVMVATEYGQKKQLTFADGSVIMLNANSALSYTLNKEKRITAANLHGEAWFEIAPREEPESEGIRVNTRQGTVYVLGTKFNVNTYREETVVVLEEGSVQVEMKDNEGQVVDSILLAPGYSARLAAGDKAIDARPANTALYTSWIQNRLRFDESPFSEVKERIKDIYGVEFFIPESRHAVFDIKISGSIPNDNIHVLLNALEGLLGSPVTIKGNTIIVDE